MIYMANTKTQKKLSISKMKSEMIFEWFINIGAANIKSRKVIQEKLNKGKSTIYRNIDKLKEVAEDRTYFDALAEVFTLSELNTLIELFNEYQTLPPEEKMTKEEKHEAAIAEQRETVNKHLNSMGMKEITDGAVKQEAKDENNKTDIDNLKSKLNHLGK